MTMRNRKTVVVAFVLVAVMLMAVGFAALSDDLFITGTATITEDAAEDAFAEDVYFSKAVISGTAGTAIIGADDNGDTADKVTITVNDGVLTGQGSSVICSVEIKNGGDLAAWVELDEITVNSNTEYFKVTTNWGTDTVKSLAAGAAVDIVVTIECIKTPQAEVDTSFDLTFTATDTDPNA